MKNTKVNELRLMQLLQLRGLKEIDNICKKLEIKYFIIAGTLLGAVRHDGFIPWDSDSDIGMLREDFKKFILNANNSLPKGYIVQSDHNDKKNKNFFARLRIKSTSFVEEGNKRDSKFDGFYIDIFPVDNAMKKPSFFDLILNKIIKLLTRVKARRNGKINSASKLNTIASSFLHVFFAPVSTKTITSFVNKVMQKHIEIDCDYVTNHNSKYGLVKQTMKKSIYGEPVKIKFDGLLLSAPEHYKIWLKKIYGDYMALPNNTNTDPNHVLKGYVYNFGKYEYLLNKTEAYVRTELGIQEVN